MDHSQGNGGGTGTGTGEGANGAGAGAGAGEGAGAGNGNGAGSGTGAGNGGNSNVPDLRTLDAKQLEAVLENPNLFNLPRIKELRDQAAQGKKLSEAAAAADEKNLTEQKKFEELAKKRGDENATLQKQLQKATVDNQLITKLAPLGVVDLSAALQLIGRGDIKVDENGTITGLDEAVTALKTEKPYLFGATDSNGKTVGTGTNSGNGNGEGAGKVMKFKRSQLSDAKFYQEHKTEILEAYRKDEIEDDISGPPAK